MGKAPLLGFLLVVSILSSSGLVSRRIPRYKLRKRNPVAAILDQLDITFNWEQQEYLDAHNAFRITVGVPPLVWDATLTEAAKRWADQRRGDCNYRHHSPTNYGENIFFMNYKEFTPADVVGLWFNETKLYDHSTNKCLCFPPRDGCECGHYLNVVWSTTRRLGCSGATYCNDQKGVFVVCNYDPRGLIPGINPFTGAKF